MKPVLFTALLALGALASGAAEVNLISGGDAESGKALFPDSAVVTKTPRSGKKCFKLNPGMIVATDFIKLNPAANYVFGGAFRALDSGSKVTVGFQCFDKNKKIIAPHYVSAVPSTLTKLATPAKAGDRTITVENGARWDARVGTIVVFNAKKDLSDLPNSDCHYYLTGKEEKSGKAVITFDRPLEKNYAAGTSVRLHRDGGYMQPVADRPTNTTWEEFSEIISGMAEYGNAANQFWHGTVYVKLFVQSSGSSPIFLDDLKLVALPKEGKVAAGAEYLYSGKRLLDKWSVRDALKIEKGADGIHASLNRWGGFDCIAPDWDAAKIKQLEVDFSCKDAPGELRLEFTAETESRSMNGRLTRTLTPDGEKHTVVFPVCDVAEWQGKIKTVRFYYVSDYETPADVKLFAVRGTGERNFIPNATLANGTATMLHSLLPRGRYRLSWNGKKAPAMTLESMDRNLKVLKTWAFAPSGKALEFDQPEMAVLSKLTVAPGGEGHPVLEQLDWKAVHSSSDMNWRGKWIWWRHEEGPDHCYAWAEKKFTLDEVPETAVVSLAVDDTFYLYVNGQLLGIGNPYYVAFRYNVADKLKKGENVIRVLIENGTQAAGMLFDGYVRTRSGKELYLDSDASWTIKVGTKEQQPDAITQPAVVLGPPPTTAPWYGMAGYRYAGPQGIIEISNVTGNGFTATVKLPLPKKIDRLRFVAKTDSGRKFPMQLAVTPDPNTWKAGEKVEVKWVKQPAVMREGYRIYLEDDYLAANDVPVATVAPFTGKAPELASVKIVDAKTRPKLEIDGKIYNPFFWHMGDFRTKPAERYYQPNEGAETGAKLFTVRSNACDVWVAPGKYNFDKIDAIVLTLLTEQPDAKIVLAAHLFMPNWWLKENPDSIGVTYDGKRLAAQYDTALSSAKWHQDACDYLRHLIGYIKDQPWANHVVAISLEESQNGEWFWETMCEYPPNGYSNADKAAFRAYLKKKYATEDALAKAWKKRVTFADAAMPTLEELTASKVGKLLDPVTQQPLIDWYEYRSLALADAIIAFAKTVKEETDGRWLTEAYYGYFIQFVTTTARPVQFVGHNAFLEVAKSPYVDAVRAPSMYGERKIGASDHIMQTQDSFTLRGKLVYIEQDTRTYTVQPEIQADYGRHETPFECMGDLNRSFAMMLAAGVSRYVLEFDDWFAEKSVREVLASNNKVFETLPPVAGTTPFEMALVGSRESVYYVRFNAKDTIANGATAYLNRTVNRAAMPYRQLVIEDLLEEGLVPPVKFYVMTAPVMLTENQRTALMKRFEREKATVLWLYAAGVTYPGSAPKAENCLNFLGIKVNMEDKIGQPVMLYGKGESWKNPTPCTPWFYPESGFDEVLGKDADGRPMLVRKSVNGSTHYFAAQLALPEKLIADLAEQAGVHRYAECTNDVWWIGNDIVSCHAATSGKKSVKLPAGTVMEAIAGPVSGTFQSGETWDAIAGQTYIFRVKK